MGEFDFWPVSKSVFASAGPIVGLSAVRLKRQVQLKCLVVADWKGGGGRKEGPVDGWSGAICPVCLLISEG